ncbi:unnamed protein product [Protopolystoma xenopodis]|uniref:Uncharacterized protein n=1 Tax=Protopolystoma xenopodis TaxID=117903 RepID=A0A448WT23_9PLAT|nr:unnamed protein product [Protopolystoma xenopodis]
MVAVWSSVFQNTLHWSIDSWWILQNLELFMWKKMQVEAVPHLVAWPSGLRRWI